MKKDIIYKGIVIEVVQGSNWVYIGNRSFTSLISAKRYITRCEAHGQLYNLQFDNALFINKRSTIKLIQNHVNS